MEIDEKWLMAAAGWQVVKEARRLLESGAVGAVRREDGAKGILVQGVVATGRRSLPGGLRIASRTDVDNLCGCPTARRTGGICEHSAAIALAAIRNRRDRSGGKAGAASGGERGADSSTAAVPERERRPGAPPSGRDLRSDAKTTQRPADIRIPKALEVPLLVQIMQDLTESWWKNRIVCKVSARPAGGENEGERADPGAVGAWLAEHGVRTLPAIIQLDRQQASALFEHLRRDGTALRANDRAAGGKGIVESAIRVADSPVRPVLTLHPALGSGSADPQFIPRVAAPPRAVLLDVEGGEACGRGWILRPEPLTLYPSAGGDASASVRERLAAAARPGGPPLPLRWVLTHHDEVSRCFRIDDADGSLGGCTVEVGRPRAILHAEGSLNSLTAYLEFHYGPVSIRIGQGGRGDDGRDPFPLADPERPGIYIIRNQSAEKELQERLVRLGFSPPDREGAMTINREENVLRFHAETIDRLRAEGIEVRVGERFRRLTASIERVRPHLVFEAGPDRAGEGGSGLGGDWLDASLEFATESGYRVPYSEIQRLLRSSSRQIRAPDGRLMVVDLEQAEELGAMLEESGVRSLPVTAGGTQLRFQISGIGAPALAAATRSAPDHGALWRIANEEVESVFLTSPEDIRSLLRPYQADGVRWLIRLALAGIGGVLGDEMGLGKTVQVLAFAAAWRGGADRGTAAGKGGVRSQGRESGNATRHRPVAGPILVVAPTSLLGTWESEAGRFVPGLRTWVHHGADRDKRWEEGKVASDESAGAGAGAEREGANAGVDLVITSYGVLAKDAEKLAAREFSAVVLDEASMIRNPDTAVARAARRLRSRVRIALTGTPVENSVMDAWSIFEFAVPGYLGRRGEFRERYAKPLAATDPPAAIVARLRTRLSPYLLRRRKSEVLPELPERIERAIYCDLAPRQAEVYRRVLEETRAGIQASPRSRSSSQMRMTMLTALLRLRQTCCDLRLLGLEMPATSGIGSIGDERGATAAAVEDGEDDVGGDSGKWGVFRELVREATEGGHRMLVFSQFTSMLRLLGEGLRADGIAYCYLDGATRDRQGEVRRFQDDSSIPVFLISLKAGGYGLTLTGADSVILFDPWWNPAVEAQAIDRAHRIGQRNAVTAYRLIAKGTIEEKILALQARKRGIFDAAVDDERPLMQGLGDEELREILELP